MKRLLILVLLLATTVAISGCGDPGTTENLVPNIVLNGDSSITITEGDTFSDPGAYIENADDFETALSIYVEGTVDTNTPDTYTIVYSVDYNDTTYSKQRTVIVEESVANNDTFVMSYDNLETTYTSISLSVSIFPNDETLNNASAVLLLDGAIIDTISLTSGNQDISFSGLMANTSYSIQINYSYDTSSSTISDTLFINDINTLEGQVVIDIELYNSTAYATEIELDILVDTAFAYNFEAQVILEDPNGGLNMYPIYRNDISFTMNHIVFDDLQPGTNYSFTVKYSYDAGGRHYSDEINLGDIATISVATPSVEINTYETTDTTFNADFITDVPSDIASVSYRIVVSQSFMEVYNEIVTDLSSLSLDNLNPDTGYTINITAYFYLWNQTYQYDSQVLTFNFTTNEENSLHMTIDDVTTNITSDSIQISFTLNDPDSQLSYADISLNSNDSNIDSRSVYRDGNSFDFTTNILSNTAYTIEITASYFDASYNLIENEVLYSIDLVTLPNTSLTSLSVSDPLYNDQDIILDLLLEGDSINVSHFLINGNSYTATYDQDKGLYTVNLGILSLGSHSLSVSSLSYVVGDQTYQLGLNQNLDITVIEHIDAPDNAMVSLLSTETTTVFQEVSSMTDLPNITIDLVFDNPYYLPINYLVINDQTYGPSDFDNLTYTSASITLPITDYNRQDFTVSAILFTRNETAITNNSLEHNTVRAYTNTQVTYISSPQEFQQIGQFGAYILTNDIDMSGLSMYSAFQKGYEFYGLLIGNGYTVSNLDTTRTAGLTGGNFASSSYSNGGLFNNIIYGYIGDITFDHLTTNLSGTSGTSYVGGLVGYAEDAVIENLSFTNTNNTMYVPYNDNAYGGVIGYAMDSRIKNISFEGSTYVYGNTNNTVYYVGGIIGRMHRSTLQYVTYEGSLSSPTSSFVTTGGIVGYTYSTANDEQIVCIEDIIFHGDITSDGSYTAGIIGMQVKDSWMVDYDNAIVNHVFFIGNIDGSSTKVSGLVGRGDSTISNALISGTFSSSNTSATISIAYGYSGDYLEVSNLYYSDTSTFLINGNSVSPANSSDSDISFTTLYDTSAFYIDTLAILSDHYQVENLDLSTDIILEILH
jgi:hypothetical protein